VAPGWAPARRFTCAPAVAGGCHTGAVLTRLAVSIDLGGSQVWTLTACLALLVALTVGVGTWAGLGQGRAVLTATLRAVAQLLLVATVIRVIFTTPALAPLYLVVMVGAATFTSGRRLRAAAGAMPAAGAAIASGAASTAVIVFATGALDWTARSVVPFSAQLIGGAMTATTLAGQRMIDDTAGSWAEVEGWLALGATPRQAVLDLGRRAAGRALVPALDQTRNVGLVVLPGAFVGLLLGGATPFEAARTQLLVLVGLLAAETVAATAVTTLLARTLALTRPTPS